MDEEKRKRIELLEFLDRKAFDPILEAFPGMYSSERDRQILGEVQREIRIERDRFHNEFLTAVEVRNNYLRDVYLERTGKIGRELEDLELPRFTTIERDFLQLCDDMNL